MPQLEKPSWELYAQGLASGKSQIAAYVAAGFSNNDGAAARLAGNARIKARVKEILDETTAYVRLSPDDLLERLENWLDVDPACLFDRRGRLKRINEIDRKTRMAIQSFDPGGRYKRPSVKFMPRERAAALYAAVSGMTRQEGPLGQTTLEQLVSASLTVNVQVNVSGAPITKTPGPLPSGGAGAVVDVTPEPAPALEGPKRDTKGG